MRKAEITRQTAETQIQVAAVLDGSGRAEVNTGIGFLDHMLDHVARHGLMDLSVTARGDLEVDAHHTVEDVGICLGKAVLQALGDMKGLARFGQACIPMDEALAEVSIDLSGRPFLVFHAELPKSKIGAFDAELTEEFFRAFAVHSRSTLHFRLHYGSNVHHCVEAMFKAFARALAQAVRIDPRVKEIPSTKGMLEA
ncbi:MAG: imidazoleglycerol-phosphate dehydratase HisB [Candidatus Hydrogenedentes bacterium]|nr:imidazoleglycerol-phosphate dehydratase HisB [Candidatus Hydrogenedentota bacterium]